jgi:hypothetical protein
MSWQVQDLSCYNSFEMEASQDTSLSVSLLIPLDEEHKSTGAFRLVIFGGDSESVPILAEDVFADLPEPLHGLYLNLPCSSSRLRLPDNCTACLWVDAEQLIRNVSLRINFQSFIHIYHSTQLLSNRSTSDYRRYRYLISSFMQFADPDPARIRKIHIGGIIRIWIRIRSGTSLQIHAICGSGPCPDPENPPWWNHKNPVSKYSPDTSSSSSIQFADRKIRPDDIIRIRIRTRFRILLIPSLSKKTPHSLKF